MEIRACLEERVRRCTVYPDCRRYRMSFFVWNPSDQAADQFCIGLKYLECGGAWPVPVGQAAEASKILAGKWQERLAQAEERGLDALKGAYVLIIGSSVDFWEDMGVLPGDCMAEFCHLEERGKWEGAFPIRLNGFGQCIEWRMKQTDTKAAAALLFHAACSLEPLSPELDLSSRKLRIFHVDYMEYHAFRESMSRRFLALLKERLEPSSCGIGAIENTPLEKLCVREALDRCPSAGELPIVGYEELKGRLKEQYRGFWGQKLWKCVTGGERMHRTDCTVGEVLMVLYGKKGLLSGTEWFRMETAAREITALVKRMVVQNQDEIEKILRKSFSLYDICYTLPGKLKEHSEKLRKELADAEDKLEKIKNSPYASESLELAHVYQGLEEYFACWDHYLALLAGYRYWESIVETAQQLREKTREVYQELKAAETVLENARIQEWNPQIPEEDSFFGKDDIFDMETLKSCMEQYFSCAVFRPEDIEKLVSEADAAFQNTKDNHVDRERHPQIHLIFQQDLWRVDAKKHYFQWVSHPVSYLPETLVIRLKLYKVPDDRQEMDDG